MAKPVPKSRSDEAPPASSTGADAQVLRDAPVPPGGIVAGKYRIDLVVGFAGAGLLCEGFHLDLGTKVLVKFMRSEHANDERAVARFLSEARSAAQLRSQHARRVLDCGKLDAGGAYVVMEWLDGEDLRRVITDWGKLPVEEAVSFVLQACQALGDAHARGLVHRDVKPENLFLSRRPDRGALITLTEPSDGVGSPHYMSPEQMIDPADVDARTDIWSLGVVLYELLTGELPFKGETVPQICANVMAAAPRSPSDIDAAIPESLAAVVLRCMDKNRDARFPDVATLAHALRDAPASVAAAPVSVAVPTVPRPSSAARHFTPTPPPSAPLPSFSGAPPPLPTAPSLPAAAPSLPAAAPSLPAAAPSLPAAAPSLPAAAPSLPAAAPSLPAAAAASQSPPAASLRAAVASESVAAPTPSIPAAARSIPAARPSRTLGPPPLPASEMPGPLVPRGPFDTRRALVAAAVLLGASLGGLLWSLRTRSASEPNGGQAVTTAAAAVDPVHPAVATATAVIVPVPSVVLPPAASDVPPPPEATVVAQTPAPSPPEAPPVARKPASEPARAPSPPPKEPPHSAPLLSGLAPSRPGPRHSSGLYPELKSPELPANIH